jgi:hypothetical protein
LNNSKEGFASDDITPLCGALDWAGARQDNWDVSLIGGRNFLYRVKTILYHPGP